MSRLSALLITVMLAMASAVHAQSTKHVGLLGWPSHPAKPMHALASEIEECLTRSIQEHAPELVIISQRAILDALFPLIEPSTEPATEEAFGNLLAREDVRARLHLRRIDYLLAFSGGTQTAPFEGAILCGAGYGGGCCLGFAWRGETTSLSAALWMLNGRGPVARESAEAKGTTVIPAFVIPVPFMAHTLGEACSALGERVVSDIRRRESTGAGIK